MNPLSVQELTSRRNEISEKHVASSVVFDPRHPYNQTTDTNAIEVLWCNLLNACADVNSALLTITIPSTNKISHDHTYGKQTDELTVSEENDERYCRKMMI